MYLKEKTVFEMWFIIRYIQCGTEKENMLGYKGIPHSSSWIHPRTLHSSILNYRVFKQPQILKEVVNVNIFLMCAVFSPP